MGRLGWRNARLEPIRNNFASRFCTRAGEFRDNGAPRLSCGRERSDLNQPNTRFKYSILFVAIVSAPSSNLKTSTEA